jgi:HEPN domain-containing protein
MAKLSRMVRFWFRSATEDLRAATTLVEAGHLRLAMFGCHLAVEKALKAVSQHQTGVLPARSHDLRLLLAQTGLTPPARLKRFIHRMAGLSVPTRYPGPLSAGRLGLRRSRVEQAVRQAERVCEWCRSNCR